MICTSHQILFGGKIKKNEMDEVCGRGAYWSLMGRPKEGVYFEDLGVDGRIMLKLCVNIYILLIFKVHIFVDLLHIKMDLGVGFGGGGCRDWIDLAQDSDRWRALVNAAMNIRFSLNCSEFLD